VEETGRLFHRKSKGREGGRVKEVRQVLGEVP